MQTALYRLPQLVLCLGLVICLGCSRRAPPATVAGTLQMQGRPVDHCLVTFFPDAGQTSAAKCSYGATDAEGAFQLRYADQQVGVEVGSYRILLQDLKTLAPIARGAEGSRNEDGPECPAAPVAARFAAVYTSAKTTPLRCEIKPGKQQIEIDLPATVQRRDVH